MSKFEPNWIISFWSTSQILTIHQILEGICTKNFEATIICQLLWGLWLLAKERNRRYPAKTIMNADYIDDIVLLVNIPTQPKSQLHSLELAAGGIGLHVNADKTEYMCFNQKGNISTLNGRSLKLVDRFTYLGSNVSSIKTDINAWLAKAWTAIDRLAVIWKSDFTDKIKRSFFQAAVVSILLYWCTT